MRWPIQLQLLLPMLIVVTLGIVLSGLAGAEFGRRWTQQQQEQNLRRVVSTLTDTVFPLNRTVLLKMQGLSGAEFVLLGGSEQPLESTLPIPGSVLALLRDLPAADGWTDLAESPTVFVRGTAYRAGRLPLARRVSAVGPASLVVLYPEDRRWAGMRQVVFPSALAGGVTALVAILTTTLLAQRFVRPIRRLRGQAAAIADGDFRPVDLGTRDDEIRDLGMSLNRMAEQLGQYENQVRHNERLRVLGQLGAGIAHQLRNAATGALMAIELHRRQCRQQASSESLDVAKRQVKLMESYLQRFLTLSRPSTPVRETILLGALVEDALELVRPSCEHARICLEFAPPKERLFVEGDAEALRQLILNLLVNAVEAAGHGSQPAPRMVVGLRRRDGRVVLSVEDSGPGPAADVAPRLFEPFVTGKPDGTGLGLWMAQTIAADHQASIAWCRRNEMTCFSVELPEAREDGSPADRG